jgi:hypothetical protein
MKADTVFDRILRRELPVRVVHEDQDVLAFHDAHPQAPVHVLVIPKKKVASLDQLGELSAEEAGRFLQAVAAVAAAWGGGFRLPGGDQLQEGRQPERGLPTPTSWGGGTCAGRRKLRQSQGHGQEDGEGDDENPAGGQDPQNPGAMRRRPQCMRGGDRQVPGQVPRLVPHEEAASRGQVPQPIPYCTMKAEPTVAHQIHQ